MKVIRSVTLSVTGKNPRGGFTLEKQSYSSDVENTQSENTQSENAEGFDAEPPTDVDLSESSTSSSFDEHNEESDQNDDLDLDVTDNAENTEDFDAEPPTDVEQSESERTDASDTESVISVTSTISHISTFDSQAFSNLEEYANANPLSITKPEPFTPPEGVNFKDFYIDFSAKIKDLIFNISLSPVCYVYELDEASHETDEPQAQAEASPLTLLKPTFRAYEDGTIVSLSYVKINNMKTFVKFKNGYKFRYNDVSLYISTKSLLSLLFPLTHSLGYNLINKLKISRSFSDFVQTGEVQPQNKLTSKTKTIKLVLKRIAKNFTEEDFNDYMTQVFD